MGYLVQKIWVSRKYQGIQLFALSVCQNHWGKYIIVSYDIIFIFWPCYWNDLRLCLLYNLRFKAVPIIIIKNYKIVMVMKFRHCILKWCNFFFLWMPVIFVLIMTSGKKEYSFMGRNSATFVCFPCHWGSNHWKERICSSRSKFFPFIDLTPFRKGFFIQGKK